MVKGDDIQQRLVDFAVGIIQLAAKLPKSSAGRHTANQILRSGTSPAPNYAEARSAESHKDFIHKLKIVLKELNETAVWLQIIVQSRLMPPEDCVLIQKACDELCKIISSSLKTAGRNRLK